MNPPYKKIQSGSKHRLLLRSVGIETSNLYTAFMALAIKQLSPDGQLVAIVPRSFCNGPYFKPFRTLLLGETALTHLHVFGSRTKAFKQDEVLQENIILKAVKGAQPGDVAITSSDGPDFELDEESGTYATGDMTERHVPYSAVVKPDDPDQFIHVASTSYDQRVVDEIAVFNEPLHALGIEVSTGPVVDFRLRRDIVQEPTSDTVPLLYSSHFERGLTIWPKEGRKPNAIYPTERARKWLYENKGCFVITRRFTSKEEKRRLVASVCDSLPGDLIGFENHLNVFHRDQKGLPKNLAYGLAAYLNSTVCDKYFRILSGHTQVNATDLRSMHYPSKKVLERIGARARKSPNRHVEEADELLRWETNKMAEGGSHDSASVDDRIRDALSILSHFGLPRGQQNDRSALTLLALLNLRPDGDWQTDIEKPLIGITPIMEFCREHYGREYAPNTRETFRRQTMHQFVEAGIALYNPDEPNRPVNSPRACYQISEEAFEAVSAYGTGEWRDKLAAFLEAQGTLAAKYAREREMEMIPVVVAPGQEIKLTPGVHSKLIRDIIEDFGPRFAPGSTVVYVGDTGEKVGYFQVELLEGLGVKVDKHGKMPDVVLYDERREWLLLIESVTSHGPVDGKRHGELSELFADATVGLVYVTAFPDRSTMGKYLSDIAWETEVWVAEAPSHLIHFNGERFLGPYES